MHLTPGNARRVVDTALALTAQPPLVEVGDAGTDAQVFAVPALGPAWQPALQGLDTRLEPGVLRPDHLRRVGCGQGRTDLVHVHLGHALMQRSARLLRSALFGVESPVHRVTAVVVEGLPQSCVAAVSRLVLVGRGGLRLHEEVFLTGIRTARAGHGRGQGGGGARRRRWTREHLTLAGDAVRAALTQEWNATDSRLRTRLLDRDDPQGRVPPGEGRRGTRRAGDRRHRPCPGDLRGVPRQPARVARPAGGARSAARRRCCSPTTSRRSAAATSGAMETGWTAWTTRSSARSRRSRERYADVKPHVSAAAVVFALTPQDAAAGTVP